MRLSNETFAAVFLVLTLLVGNVYGLFQAWDVQWWIRMPILVILGSGLLVWLRHRLDTAASEKGSNR